MSWTSQAYDALKDFQSLAAACVALGAAIIAFLSQRYVVNRQLEYQRQKERDERSGTRLGFAVRLLSYNEKIRTEFIIIGIQIKELQKKGNEQEIDDLSDNPVWLSLAQGGRLSDLVDLESMFDKGFTISGQDVQQSLTKIVSNLRRWDVGFATLIELANRSDLISKKSLASISDAADKTVAKLAATEETLKKAIATLETRSAYSREIH